METARSSLGWIIMGCTNGGRTRLMTVRALARCQHAWSSGQRRREVLSPGTKSRGKLYDAGNLGLSRALPERHYVG